MILWLIYHHIYFEGTKKEKLLMLFLIDQIRQMAGEWVNDEWRKLKNEI